MAWQNLEHTVWNHLKNFGLHQATQFAVAASGGLDSMVLLDVLKSVRPQAAVDVYHFHHGAFGSEEQIRFRNECRTLIAEFCEANPQFRFKVGESPFELRSEDEMRRARWDFIHKTRQVDVPILTAHHLDDWIETLTIKLIRGVGQEGFVSFRMWDGVIFRPFLETKKSDLLEFARDKNLKWIEDPSNADPRFLRNWVREKWFKELDERISGGYENYSRSLLRLVQELNQDETFDLHYYKNDALLGLDRNWYQSLSEKNQLKALAQLLRHHYLRQHGKTQMTGGFTSGQLAEIQKRLDKNQKDLTFIIANVNWVINERQIMLT